MNLWKQLKGWMNRWSYAGIWLLVLFCGMVFLISSLFPKYSYGITEYHVIPEEDENEVWIPLMPDVVVTYQLYIEGDAINGIEPCFDWGRDSCPEGEIVIEAWHEEGYPSQEAYIGETRIRMDAGLRKAYAYAELPNRDELKGDLVFTLRYETQEENPSDYPYVIATDKRMDNSRTLVNGEAIEGDLLMYYVTLRKTYPLVFDARMLFLLFAAVAFTMSGKRRARQSAPEKVSKEEGMTA